MTIVVLQKGKVKMTDEEIIKTLECCADSENYQCNKCPLYADCEKTSIAENALDLINRQQAEIERLRKEVNLVSIQFQDLQERYEEAQIIAQRKGVITMQNDMTDKQRKEDKGK